MSSSYRDARWRKLTSFLWSKKCSNPWPYKLKILWKTRFWGCFLCPRPRGVRNSAVNTASKLHFQHFRFLLTLFVLNNSTRVVVLVSLSHFHSRFCQSFLVSQLVHWSGLWNAKRKHKPLKTSASTRWETKHSCRSHGQTHTEVSSGNKTCVVFRKLQKLNVTVLNSKTKKLQPAKCLLTVFSKTSVLKTRCFCSAYSSLKVEASVRQHC